MLKPVWPRMVNPYHPLMQENKLFLTFNEGTGDKVEDLSGATAQGDIAVFADLNGTSQYFYRTDADFPESGITGANDLTIQGWIRLNTLSACFIVTKHTAGKRMYSFEQSGGQLYLYISNDGVGWSSRVSTNADITVGVWHHVAVVYDAGDSSCTFYKNGVLLTDNGGVLDNSISDENPNFVVGSKFGGGGYLNGSLFNVCLFDDKRTPTEILASVSDKNENVSSEGNIVGQWMFNEAGAAAAIDNTQGDSGRDLIPYDGGDVTFANLRGTASLRTAPRYGAIYGATWVGGKDGPALRFDGSNYIDCGNDADLNITGAITIEVQIKTSDTGTQYLVCKMDGADDGYSMAIVSQHLYMSVNDGKKEGTVDIVDGLWHRLHAVYDGADIRLYVDSVLDVTETIGSKTMSTSKRLFIGQLYNQASRFVGDMGHVLIHNRALSTEDIVERCSRPYKVFR